MAKRSKFDRHIAAADESPATGSLDAVQELDAVKGQIAFDAANGFPYSVVLLVVVYAILRVGEGALRALFRASAGPRESRPPMRPGSRPWT